MRQTALSQQSDSHVPSIDGTSCLWFWSMEERSMINRLRGSGVLKMEVATFMRGALTSIVAAGVFMVVSLVLHHHIGISKTLSTQIGNLPAAFVSYFGHWWFTFEVKAADRLQFVRFVLSVALASAMSWIATDVLTPLLHIPYWAALAWVLVLVPLLSYLMMRCFVFVPRKGN